MFLLIGVKKIADCNNFQIWTKNGWQNIETLARHKTEKNIFIEYEQNMELLM